MRELSADMLVESKNEIYLLLRPPKRQLSLGRGRILIPGFTKSTPMIVVYDVAYCLPLGDVS